MNPRGCRLSSSMHSSRRTRISLLGAISTQQMRLTPSRLLVSPLQYSNMPQRQHQHQSQNRSYSTQAPPQDITNPLESSHQFESDLKSANYTFERTLDEKEQRLENVYLQLTNQSQGHYGQTLELLLELYRTNTPLNDAVATSFLESFFNCKRFDELEYFFHKWFNSAIHPKPYMDRAWINYIVSMYEKRGKSAESAALKDMIYNAQRLLPHEQKFATPREEDYMLLLTTYSKIGDVNKFMEARSGMKKDLQQPEQDEPWVIACSLALLKESGNKDAALKVFASNFDSSLHPNPNLPPPSLKEYIILLSIFSARGDVEECKRIFAAAEADLGNMDQEFRVITLLIQAFARNNDSDNAWVIFKRFFRTFDQNEERDNRLTPDSAVLSILLSMYTRGRDETMIQRVVNISNMVLREDMKRKRDAFRESSKDNSMTIQPAQPAQPVHPAFSEAHIDNFEIDLEEQTPEVEVHNIEDIIFDREQAKGFKLDYRFSTTFIRACLAIDKPDLALDHFKKYYKSKISYKPNDPLLLLPTLGFYGRLMHEFLYVYNPSIVEDLYNCLQQDFPIDAISRFAPINHAILILYIREQRFEEMMNIFEERFQSSMSENTKNNPLILKSYTAKEIMLAFLKEGKIEELYGFLDLILRDEPRRDPKHLFTFLLNEALENKYAVGAVLDYFLQKDNYKSPDDLVAVEGALISKFATRLRDGDVTQIISWFTQIPLQHQFIPRIASIYISALIRVTTIEETWNEFLRLFRLPKQLKPMAKYIETSSQEYEKSPPDEATYSVILNALSGNGMIEACKELLECVKIDLPHAYTKLYYFLILASAKRGNYEFTLSELKGFYNDKNIPPIKLLKEIIFDCPSKHIHIARVALEAFEKYYPNDPMHAKLVNSIKKKQKRSSDSKFASTTLQCSGVEQEEIYESLPAEEKLKLENVMKVVNSYTMEKNFDKAIGFLPSPESNIRVRREDYMNLVQTIAKSGQLHHLKEILIHAKLDGHSAVVFADQIVTGLLGANLVNEAVAFFKKLYQTTFGQGTPNASKPPREVYLELIRELRRFSTKDDQLSSVLLQVQKSFNIHYPPLLSRKSRDRMREKREEV